MEEIRSGRLTPDKLIAMSSLEARKYFSDVIGDEAGKELNILFEKKLLLKNQDKAMYDFFKNATGLSKEEKLALTEKAKTRLAEINGRIFSPKEGERVLSELASDIYAKKYKILPTQEEMDTITNLSTDVANAMEKADMEKMTWGSKENGLKFGAAQVALENYTASLKATAGKRSLMNPLTTNAVKATVNNASVAANFILTNSRVLMTTFDNSLWGNQGVRAMLDSRYEKIWAKDFAKSFADIAQTIKGGTKRGEAIMDATRAWVYSQDEYLKGYYTNKGGIGLDIKVSEENFPQNDVNKIPVIGRFFKASDVVYSAGALRLRVDIANLEYKLAEKDGEDLTDVAVLSSKNLLINSLTGRGNIGVFEPASKVINIGLFAVKLAKSQIDFLTAHVFDPRVSWKDKYNSVKRLLNVWAHLAIIVGIGAALWPDDNKGAFDPTSTNFMSVNVKKVRLIKPGFVSYLTVIARIVSQKTTNAEGKVTELGSGYGVPTGMDVFWSFTEGKFSPLLGVLRDIVRQQNFNGDKPTLQNILANVGTPIGVQNAIQMGKNYDGNLLLAIIANILNFNGFNVSSLVYTSNTAPKSPTIGGKKSIRSK
jgi:hypothetical protein